MVLFYKRLCLLIILSLFTFSASPHLLTVTSFVRISLLPVFPQHTDRISSPHPRPERSQRVDLEQRCCWVKPDPVGRPLLRKAFNGVLTPTQSSNSPPVRQPGEHREHGGNTAGHCAAETRASCPATARHIFPCSGPTQITQLN